MPAPQKLIRSSCDALTQHLRAIGRIPLLTHEEEITLGRAVQKAQQLLEIEEELTLRAGGVVPSQESWAAEAGLTPVELKRRLRQGARAKNRMVAANLRLVVTIARKYASLQLELEDVIQEGNLGLIKAVEKFDPTRGYKFSTYGYWWIRQSVSRHIKERGQAIRVPPEINNLARRAKEQRAVDSQPRSLERTAARLGLTLQRLEEVLRIHHISHMVSLDQVCGAGQDGDQTLLDLIRGDDGPVAEETYDWLHRHLRELKPEERRVLELRFNGEHDYSFAQVAALLGLKKSQAQWLEKHALRKLYKRLRHGCLDREGAPA